MSTIATRAPSAASTCAVSTIRCRTRPPVISDTLSTNSACAPIPPDLTGVARAAAGVRGPTLRDRPQFPPVHPVVTCRVSRFDPSVPRPRMSTTPTIRRQCERRRGTGSSGRPPLLADRLLTRLRSARSSSWRARGRLLDRSGENQDSFMSRGTRDRTHADQSVRTSRLARPAHPRHAAGMAGRVCRSMATHPRVLRRYSEASRADHAVAVTILPNSYVVTGHMRRFLASVGKAERQAAHDQLVLLFNALDHLMHVTQMMDDPPVVASHVRRAHRPVLAWAFRPLVTAGSSRPETVLGTATTSEPSNPQEETIMNGVTLLPKDDYFLSSDQSGRKCGSARSGKSRPATDCSARGQASAREGRVPVA